MKFRRLCFILLIFFGCNTDPEIAPQVNTDLDVFPNPCEIMATISFDNPGNKPFTLLVFGTTGEVLFERNEDVSEAYYDVNLSAEPKGTYHVVLKTGNSTITRTFFKR